MRVRGEGRAPCDWAIVGEGPGWQEDLRGRPFVGDTGDELERQLEQHGIPPRARWFLTNIYREYGGKDYKWTAEDFERDWPELVRELKRVSPSLVVTLGRYATRCFLGDVDMDSTQGIAWIYPRIHPDLDDFLPDPLVVFPIVHPAAGMHNPEMSPYVNDGFHQLSKFLDGKMEPRELWDDPYPEVEYVELTNVQQMREYLRGLSPHSRVSIDTEGLPGKPWSLQFSYQPGTAYLISRDREDVLHAFIDTLRRAQTRIVFHSALHDLGVGRTLDTDFSGLRFDDTQVMAYLLQVVPLGLKAGSLRFCGMRMSEYMDIMGDRQNELARDYLTWIWDAEAADHEERQHAAFAAEIAKGRKIKVLPKLPKSRLLKATERVLSSKRPSALWEEQDLDIQVAGYNRAGAPPIATLDYVDHERAVAYGCRDADATGRLLEVYEPRLEEMGLRDVYELELSTYPLLDRMQQIGIRPDLDHMAFLGGALESAIAMFQQELEELTGKKGFNANSFIQVAEFLYGELGLEEIKFTSSGLGSTNDFILEALQNENPQFFREISSIRNFREFYKLKHTFVDRVPDYVKRWPFDGRVHTTLRTTRVVTGRLAAADPNMLAQPERGDWAKIFKRGWVAEDGHEVCNWDESQIELRGLAHLSQDPTLLAVYRGERRNPDGSLIDLHAALAQRIFGGNTKDYAKGPQRRAAKAVNFGLPMGMGPKGLSVQLRKNGLEVGEDDAQKWIDETFALYTGVAEYKRQKVAEAQQNGFVRCLSGRIRYIGGIRSRKDRVREEAERFAFSTPIQESAQTIMKTAEAYIWTDVLPEFWKKGIYCEPLLQVHDALKFEVERGHENELNAAMQKAMVEVPAHWFSVPLAIEGEHGPNFCDTVAFEA
jgi:uracil-DNA glycosylase family 4